MTIVYLQYLGLSRIRDNRHVRVNPFMHGHEYIHLGGAILIAQ